VKNRKHERAAVEDDFLAAEAGADIGFVTRRAAVEFGKQETDNKTPIATGTASSHMCFKPCLNVVAQ
jgi:hypothetical protein